jgi:uncharacterized membrane protein
LTPIISSEQDLAIWAILLTLASLGLWLEGTVVGRKFSGVLTAMIIGGVLSNTGVIPTVAPAYDRVWSFLVPLAIPLFLLKANLPSIARSTGSMLVPFALAVLGTMLGTVAAVFLIPVPEHSNELIGLLSASYIGGAINFAAVSTTMGIVDTGFLATVAAADNMVGAMYIAILAALPSSMFVRRFLPARESARPPAAVNDSLPDGRIGAVGVTAAVATSAVICAVSYALADAVGLFSYRVIFITVISLAVANSFENRLSKIRGEFDVGLVFMYLFLITLGVQADASGVIESGLQIVWFVVVLVTVHFTTVAIGSKLLKVDLGDAIIASNACTAGPTTAIALSAARGWHDKTTPGLMCGILGYALANFIALWLVALLGT